MDTKVNEWRQVVRGEYLEIPGLHLTRGQVQRLWGIDAATCDAVVGSLVDERFLRRTATDTYVRVGDGCH